MRIHHSSLARTLITIVISGCMGGTGSGLVGINGGDGGGGIGTGSVRSLVFSVQPSNADSGNFITPAVQITALDAFSAVDTSFRGSVTVTLAANTTGATLGGTRTTNAVAGVATFGDLSLNRPGSYALQAAGGGASATSRGFTISPPPPPLR